MKRRLNGIAAYEYWVLRALSDNGGLDKVRRVYEVVFENMRDQFGVHELAIVRTDGSNKPRWMNETRWARLNLVKDGRMEPSEDHGTWQIGEKGNAWLKDNPTPPNLNSLSDYDDDLDGDV
jgi:hypothetical protein